MKKLAFLMCMLFAVFSCTDSDKASADALDPIVKVYDDAVIAVEKAEDADSLISVVNGVKKDVLAAVEQFKASGKILSSADKIEALKKVDEANKSFQLKLDRKATELGATPRQREEIIDLLKGISYSI